MHGGRIEIDSELGEGTTVSLFFPPERTRPRWRGNKAGPRTQACVNALLIIFRVGVSGI